MSYSNSLSLCVVALVAGCTADPAAEPSVGNEQLGIVEFETTQTFDRLDIFGLDADRSVVARVSLQVRHVVLPEDGLAGLGREFSVEVRAQGMTHESVGLHTLAFPAPEIPEFAELLYDPYVNHLLALRGVGFEDRWASEVGGEATEDEATDYGHSGSCAGFVPGCSGSGAWACCLDHADGSGNKSQKVICAYNGNRALRSCKAPGVATACGTAGPEGCAVCPGYPIVSSPPNTDITWSSNTCNWKSCRWVGQSCTSASQCCADYGETLDCWNGQCIIM